MKKTIPLSKIIAAAFLIFTAGAVSAQHTITKLWATDSVLNTPESVLPANGVLYVSLIDGGPWDKDGKGGVAQLSPDGKVINANWVTGLSAPKGLGIHGNWLYAADVDEVAVINIKEGKIDHKIPVAGAKGLNDITVDDKGVVYVTDSMTGMVHKIENDKASPYQEGFKGINGAKAVGSKLYVLTSDGMYLAGADKKSTKICVLEHGGDGIEPVDNGDFLVTAWEGYLYYVQANGTKDILLDTHTTNNKTADIGYDAKARVIYVPTFMGKSVVAYKLK
jgi:hypothetical protein